MVLLLSQGLVPIGIQALSPSPLLYGVAQGFMLSLLLFNIYINLLREVICQHGIIMWFHQYSDVI